MKMPSLSDKLVKVRAYLTDEAFGYEHWRAAQFCAPADGQPALLVICADGDERQKVEDYLRGREANG